MSSRYNSNNSRADNIKFASRKEAAHYRQLKQRRLDGEVKYFLRKVPFDLGSYGTCACGFLVVWVDDTVTFENVKSPVIPHLVTGKTMAEQLDNVKIEQI